MNTIETVPITPLDVMTAYCNGKIPEAFSDLKSKMIAIGGGKDPDFDLIASGYFIHLSVLALKGHPDTTEVECHNLMRKEGAKAIPEMLWDITGSPASTAWFMEFKDRFDGTVKRLKERDWTVKQENNE